MRACVRACVCVCIFCIIMLELLSIYKLLIFLDNIFHLDVHYVCMLVQRFEPKGRRFTNFHYYYYYTLQNSCCCPELVILLLGCQNVRFDTYIDETCCFQFFTQVVSNACNLCHRLVTNRLCHKFMVLLRRRRVSAARKEQYLLINK